MAICATCGKEIRDDVWTCGHCGAPVAQSPAQETGSGEESPYGSEGYNPYAAKAAASSAYGAASYGGVEPDGGQYGGASYAATSAPPPENPPAKSAGLSQTMKLVLVFAGVAIVAIVAVWFFVLRGSGGGDQFVGTWTAVKNGESGLVIERGGDGLQVSMTGADKRSVGPLRTDLDGDRLEIRLEVIDGDDRQKAAVGMVRSLFEATIEDFSMVLRYRSADSHLLMTVSGKSLVGGQQATMPVTEFARVGATPSL